MKSRSVGGRCGVRRRRVAVDEVKELCGVVCEDYWRVMPAMSLASSTPSAAAAAGAEWSSENVARLGRRARGGDRGDLGRRDARVAREPPSAVDGAASRRRGARRAHVRIAVALQKKIFGDSMSPASQPCLLLRHGDFSLCQCASALVDGLH